MTLAILIYSGFVEKWLSCFFTRRAEAPLLVFHEAMPRAYLKDILSYHKGIFKSFFLFLRQGLTREDFSAIIIMCKYFAPASNLFAREYIISMTSDLPFWRRGAFMEKQNRKGWLYILPATVFLGIFLVYPLIDVFIYSFEEGFNSASGTFFGIGIYNYLYVLNDPFFIQAMKNTFILVIITVPVSTLLALLISLGLSSIQKLRNLFQTIFFLPYVTNTLAVGLVFMLLFQKTDHTAGLVNGMLGLFGMEAIDFITGPYWAKMFVLCFYTVWVVLPFKILILTSAIASVNPNYYDAARVDGTGSFRMFTKITVPLISPMLFYLIITGFIGAFKAYSDAVALFGSDLNVAEMNTIVGYIYDMLYGEGGGYPSYASAAAIILFIIVLTITCINLTVSKKHVHYS